MSRTYECPVCYHTRKRSVPLRFERVAMKRGWREEPEGWVRCYECGAHWDSPGHYSAWLKQNMEKLKEVARALKQEIEGEERPTKEDEAWSAEMEERMEFRRWEVAKFYSEGREPVTGVPRSAWD